jgi:hypothetical protein
MTADTMTALDRITERVVAVVKKGGLLDRGIEAAWKLVVAFLVTKKGTDR